MMIPSLPSNQFWLMIGEVPTGPFDVPQVHAELAAGRATWQTPACAVGGNNWLPLLKTSGIGPETNEAPVVIERTETDSPPTAPSLAVPACAPKTTTGSASDRSDQVAVVIGIGLLLVVIAAVVGAAYGVYEWLRPYTPREVAVRFGEAETATEAKRYATPRMHPFIDSIFADPSSLNPNDKFELTQETDGPKPGIKLVGFHGSFYSPDAARRVRMEGHMRLVLSEGWKVDDMVVTELEGAALKGPVSLVEDFHNNGGPGGSSNPANKRSSSPAKRLTEPPFQGKGVGAVFTWFLNHYGWGGVVLLILVFGIGAGVWDNLKRKKK